MITVYGIPTCDTCKKALKALQAAGHEAVLHDIRKDPLSSAEIEEFVREFGDAIINRSSVTWRNASAFVRESEPEAQIAEQPTLMKRPVIRGPEGLTLGWDAQVQARYL